MFDRTHAVPDISQTAIGQVDVTKTEQEQDYQDVVVHPVQRGEVETVDFVDEGEDHESDGDAQTQDETGTEGETGGTGGETDVGACVQHQQTEGKEETGEDVQTLVTRETA